MSTTDDQKAGDDSLRAQLHELNERSRWYSSQLWQVPFAFFGIVGIALGAVLDKGNAIIGLALLVLGGFGVAVVLHMHGLADGERRAVFHLQKMEERLYLEQTAKYKAKQIWASFNIAVTAITVLCFLLGIYLLIGP